MNTPIRVTYFDTAMALIEVGSVRFLTDPVFDASGKTFDYGPLHLEKTGGPAIQPEKLGRIDAVLLSHDQHGDNLDDGGRAFLPSAGVVLTTMEGAGRLAGVHAVGMREWSQTTVQSPDGESVTVTAVPAQHGPDGTQDATGSVIGFVLESPRQEFRPVYLSGDTIRFEGTDQIAARYAPVGLALLNIGRVRLEPMGPLEFSMSAEEAVQYASALQARWVAPLHFEGWRHFSQSRAEAAAVFAQSEMGGRVRWLERGVAAVFEI
jgi:L-ascorbate metabolism protein UlaG (beta-lactamase superfamily)